MKELADGLRVYTGDVDKRPDAWTYFEAAGVVSLGAAVGFGVSGEINGLTAALVASIAFGMEAEFLRG